MGGTDMNNLKRFLKFIKEKVDDPPEILWLRHGRGKNGAHHHFYLNSGRFSENSWLENMLRGVSIDGWADKFQWMLNELKDMPSGESPIVGSEGRSKVASS